MRRRARPVDVPAELARFDPGGMSARDWYTAREAWQRAHPDQELPDPPSWPDEPVDWDALGLAGPGGGHYTFGTRVR